MAAGAFAKRIMEIAAPRKLYLIDYWKVGRRAHGFAGRRDGEPGDYEQVQRAFAGDDRVCLMRGWSWEQIGLLADGSLDWIYLDAGHDFDSVSRDLEAVLPKMKPDGIIAGHDFVRWGSHGYRGGVVEAVVRFCVRNGFGLVGFTFEADYPPSYAIRRL